MRIGLLGAGGMGRVHARQYARRGDVELFVHDRDHDRGVALAEANGGTPVDAIEELFKRCDAVDICLPTHLHVQIGLQAIAEILKCILALSGRYVRDTSYEKPVQ